MLSGILARHYSKEAFDEIFPRNGRSFEYSQIKDFLITLQNENPDQLKERTKEESSYEQNEKSFERRWARHIGNKVNGIRFTANLVNQVCENVAASHVYFVNPQFSAAAVYYSLGL